MVLDLKIRAVQCLRLLLWLDQFALEDLNIPLKAVEKELGE